MLFGSSPELLVELLTELERLLKRAGSPVERLGAGLAPNQVVDILASAGLGAPAELVAWFGWHNGGEANSPEAAQVIPGVFVTSLEEAIARQETLLVGLADVAKTRPNADEDGYWGAPRGWLGISDDNYGPAVDCEGSPRMPPRIRATTPFFGDDPGHRAVSMCTLVAWWIFGLHNGGYERRESEWDTKPDKLHPLQVASFFF